MCEILTRKDGKFRWDAQLQDALFELYIPDWRVPEPIPERIRVNVCLNGKATGIIEEDVVANPDLRNRNIMAEARFREEKTKTHRYDAIGEPNQTEIGNPFIPFSLLPSRPERVWLYVEWL
jgi:hypothetical protein